MTKRSFPDHPLRKEQRKLPARQLADMAGRITMGDAAYAARSLSLVLLSLLLLPVTGTGILIVRAVHLLSRPPSSSSGSNNNNNSNAEIDQISPSRRQDHPHHAASSPRSGGIVAHRTGHRQHQRTPRRTILVTGVGMAKGLTLARAFHLCGHRVVGADVETSRIPCSGRFSRALNKFYPLEKPTGGDGSREVGEKYIRKLVEIIQAEGVDLWVSCSGVSSAAEDAEAKEVIESRTRCRCIQFDVSTTMELHEKDSFMRACERLGLPVPETHDVTSPGKVIEILKKGNDKEQDSEDGGEKARKSFILKPVGVDDSNRANMTLLPLKTAVLAGRTSLSSSSDNSIAWGETITYVSRLPISKENPWILQQFIPGGQEYCTHALIVRNEVKAFVACSSAELLMHYEALPPDSGLSQAMLEFTRAYIERNIAQQSEDRKGAEMTGHLSFDFMVEDVAVEAGKYERKMYAIECNPRAHTAVVLFGGAKSDVMEDMVEAYISAIPLPRAVTRSRRTNGLGIKENDLDSRLLGDTNGEDDSVAQPMVKGVFSEPVTPIERSTSRYWIGHDIFAFVLHPISRMLAGDMSAGSDLVHGTIKLLEHVLTWKEGTFEAWDPMPALALYHVYWPLTILAALWHGRRWSRVNVSTTKMFLC